ncbi:acyl-CoA N-acyltransferase [Gloeopeniophorella convolvens]|nr:acyl-CoA N-acyltransferase [Gloeopeniophorella convolvens]
MAYTNSYKTPTGPGELRGCTGPDPYDLNFVLPLREGQLESDRVRLAPFVPAKHAQEYHAQVTAHPALERYLPFRSDDLDALLAKIELEVRRAPGNVLLAIIDKTRGSSGDGSMAGVIALTGTSRAHLSTEIDWVVVFPAFQRTHVATHTVGLLLRLCLEPPPRGHGLRRVQWIAAPENAPSVAAARRMGFALEGTLRWVHVLPEGKLGAKLVRAGDPGAWAPGKHSVVLAMCADDWEAGGRERVRRLMDR